jgi:hypothetical protein
MSKSPLQPISCYALQLQPFQLYKKNGKGLLKNNFERGACTQLPLKVSAKENIF